MLRMCFLHYIAQWIKRSFIDVSKIFYSKEEWKIRFVEF